MRILTRGVSFWVSPVRIILVLVLAVTSTATASAQSVNSPGLTRDDTILIGYKRGTLEQRQRSVDALHGARHVHESYGGAHILKVAPGGALRISAELRKHPEVLFVEPDMLMQADGSPNDAYFGLQWAPFNRGQLVNGTSGTAGADEKLVPAWNVTKGSTGVVVAVVDTGVEYNHPDLALNIWSNPGGIGGCGAGTHGYNVLNQSCDPMDDDNSYGGHGTHVAGIIGAVGDNGIGVAGVNWITSILPIKWMDSTGHGYTSDLITALDWVISAKKAGVNIRVANDSGTWVGTASSQALSNEIDALGTNDILFVSAAGNTAQNNDDPSTPRFPCNYNRPNQLCVTASDQNDHLWSSANYGSSHVDLAAPGMNIYSTVRGAGYGYISGGSMAAAQASGAAALILSTGYKSTAELKSVILNSVDVLPTLSGAVRSGGRLNVCSAVPGCTGNSGPSPNLVQKTSTEASYSNSVSAAFPSANRAGNLIIAVVRASITTQTVSLSDNLGNRYTEAVRQNQTTDGHQLHIFYAPNIRAGVNTLVATFSASNNHPWLGIFEYSGLSTTNPLDSTSSAQGYGSAASTGSAQTRSSNELVFSALSLPSSSALTVSAGAGFSLEQQDTGTSRSAAEDEVAVASGSVTGTFTLSGNTNWAAALATFSPTAIASAKLSVSTTSLPPGTAGTGYTATLSASGGTSPYAWALSSGSLPNGLTLSSQGTISGTPGSSGPSTFTVQVTDASSNVASQQLSIVVNRSGAPAIALLQSASAAGSSQASVTQAFPNANTGGDLIIAVVRMSTSTQTVQVSDTAGNLYTDAVSQAQSTDGHQLHMFYARNIAAGPNTVTASFSSTNNHPWLAIYEFRGWSATSPLDQTARAQGFSAVPSTGATATTSSPNELVVAALGMPATSSAMVSAGSGFSLLQQDTNTSRAANESQVVSVIGQYSGIFQLSTSVNWSAILATFKQ